MITLCLLSFINPAIYGYKIRIILQYTVVGLMLIPFYLMFKIKPVLSKTYLIEMILYGVMIIITVYNSQTQEDIARYYAILQGRLPAFLSLQTYMYSFVFIVITATYFKDIFTKTTIKIIYLTHLVLGVFIVITNILGVGAPLYFGFGNANYVGEPFAILYLLIVLPRLVSTISSKDIVISSSLLYFALYPNSRATQLAIFGALLTSALYASIRKNISKKTVIAVTTQVVVVLILVYFSTNYRVLQVDSFLSGEITLNNLSSGRLNLWRQIIVSTIETPKTLFFGLGPSTFLYYGATNFNAHNMLIEIFGSMGIIGLLSALYIFISLSIKTIKLSTKSSNQYLVGLLVFVIIKWNLNSMMALTSFYYLIIIALIIYKYREAQHAIN